MKIYSNKKRPVKASYTYKYAVWVLDGDDNTWKVWSGKNSTDLGMSDDEFLDAINHPSFPNPEYNVDNNYVDVMVIDGDKTPADYGATENIKDYPEYNGVDASTRKSTSSKAIKAATDVNNLKIIINSVGYVEVDEDDYNEGEGEYVNQWTFDISGTYNSIQEVVDAIAKETGATSDINDYVYIDGRISTDMEQNADGLYPTDAEFEAWKRNEETLYVAHIDVYLNVGVEIHEMTEDEAKAFGIPLY